MQERIAVYVSPNDLTDIEIGWPCKSAIRAPVGGLDSPRAIFQGSYQELRAFENAYNRARGAA